MHTTQNPIVLIAGECATGEFAAGGRERCVHADAPSSLPQGGRRKASFVCGCSEERRIGPWFQCMWGRSVLASSVTKRGVQGTGKH